MAEVLSSPFYQPISKMQLRLFEALRLGRCQLCDSIFEIGAAEGTNWYTKVTKEDLPRAIKEEKGFMFWNRELAERKRRLGIRGSKDDETTWERRFFCKDCVWAVLKQLHCDSEE